MTTQADILSILQHGEHLTLECKLAENSLPKSVWETYSAFANTVGGTILLGVEEHKEEVEISKRFVIKGVQKVSKIIEDFWNTINSQKVNENILYDRDVKAIDVNGKNIICITIPQADWRIRPIFLNENMSKGSYKRNHEGDYHCTEKEIHAMIRDANDDGNDGSPMENYTMDDIDLDTLHSYRNFFRVANQDHPWNDVNDKTFLIKLNGYYINRSTNKEGLTAAGLMMFGKGDSICERFGNFRMDYLDMKNLRDNERYRDRLTYDGRWENNFYQFFRTILPKLTFGMPRPFRLKKGLQRKDDTLQIEAVREAFTNAIIHCDIFAAGILRIEKHDDRLILRNPGTLLLPIEKVYAGGSSKARNPRIQRMLRMIGYGENVGSGFPKIIKAWQQASWKIPTIENDLIDNEVKLTLYIPFEKENDPSDPSHEPSRGQNNPSSYLCEPSYDPNKGQNDPSSKPYEPSYDPSRGQNNPRSYLYEPSYDPNKGQNDPSRKPYEPSSGQNDPSHDPKRLTQRQQEIIDIIGKNDTISRKHLATKFNISESTIKRELANLKEKGILKREGKTSGHWIIILNQ